MNTKPKLLIVDDEAEICSLLKDLLSEDFETDTATNGAEAYTKAKQWHPQVILMDVMMPKVDGFAACESIRNDDATRHIPILMVTALNSGQDRMKAFDLGADDFVAKPFDVQELLVRIKSKLRRAKELRNIPQEVVQLANLALNVPAREVRIGDGLIDLSPVEYGILTLLIARQGEVISRREIMDEVWEDEQKSDRLIDAHVTSLRKKIAGFQGGIQTIYGEGYRIKTLS